MFGFPLVEHKVYKNNFLRNIILIFHFNQAELKGKEQTFRGRLDQFFPQFQLSKAESLNITFGNNTGKIQSQNISEEKDIFTFKTKAGQSSLVINDSSFLFNFNGLEYQSFNNIKNIVQDILTIANEDLEINIFNNIIFRKLNVLEVNAPNDNMIGDISYTAYNQFISDINRVPQTQFLINDFRTLTMKNQVENTNLNLKYGLNSPLSIPGQINHIFIDCEISAINVDSNNAIEKIQKINTELFNIFNWVSSQNLIRLLEQNG